MNQNNPLELRAGPLRLALRPDLGGSIAGLWHGDTPVLRSVEPAALAAPRKSACFPLVPYSEPPGLQALPLARPRAHHRWPTSATTTRTRCTAAPGRSRGA